MRERCGKRVKLTKEKDLCRLLTLFDEFPGFLETFVDRSGNPGSLFLVLNALNALVLSLFRWGHEHRNEGVVSPLTIGEGLHEEGEGGGTCLWAETREERGGF